MARLSAPHTVEASVIAHCKTVHASGPWHKRHQNDQDQEEGNKHLGQVVEVDVFL